MNRISELMKGSRAVICFDDISRNASKEHGGPAAIEVETGLLLYSMILRMRPKVIVETGTYKGYSAAWMASALADIQDNYPDAIQRGHLWTIDHNNKDPKEFWDWLDISPYITYNVGNSFSWDPDLPDKIDFLWLDADHSKKAVIDEFIKFKLRLADYCVVGFHDTWLVPEISEAIEEIKKCHMPEGYKIEHLYFRNLRGMDMLLLHKGELLTKKQINEMNQVGLKAAEAGAKSAKDILVQLTQNPIGEPPILSAKDFLNHIENKGK